MKTTSAKTTGKYTNLTPYGELADERGLWWRLYHDDDPLNWNFFMPFFEGPWPYHWQSAWVLLARVRL